MDGWNNGMMGEKFSLIDLTQYSTIPLFHYSSSAGLWQTGSLN